MQEAANFALITAWVKKKTEGERGTKHLWDFRLLRKGGFFHCTSIYTPYIVLCVGPSAHINSARLPRRDRQTDRQTARLWCRLPACQLTLHAHCTRRACVCVHVCVCMCVRMRAWCFSVFVQKTIANMLPQRNKQTVRAQRISYFEPAPTTTVYCPL